MRIARQERLKPPCDKTEIAPVGNNWRRILIRIFARPGRRAVVLVLLPPLLHGLWSAPQDHEWPYMTISLPDASRFQKSVKVAKDFQEHLAALEQRGLVVRVERPINKD